MPGHSPILIWDLSTFDAVLRLHARTDHGHHLLDNDGNKQYRTLDGIIDQGVHAQGAMILSMMV